METNVCRRRERWIGCVYKFCSYEITLSLHICKFFVETDFSSISLFFRCWGNTVYIQHSERQQLGLERRFFKYSEIQGEREKMANLRNFNQGCIWGVYTPAHKWKRKNGTTKNIEGLQ